MINSSTANNSIISDNQTLSSSFAKGNDGVYSGGKQSESQDLILNLQIKQLESILQTKDGASNQQEETTQQYFNIKEMIKQEQDNEW